MYLSCFEIHLFCFRKKDTLSLHNDERNPHFWRQPEENYFAPSRLEVGWSAVMKRYWYHLNDFIPVDHFYYRRNYRRTLISLHFYLYIYMYTLSQKSAWNLNMMVLSLKNSCCVRTPCSGFILVFQVVVNTNIWCLVVILEVCGECFIIMLHQSFIPVWRILPNFPIYISEMGPPPISWKRIQDTVLTLMTNMRSLSFAFSW